MKQKKYNFHELRSLLHRRTIDRLPEDVNKDILDFARLTGIHDVFNVEKKVRESAVKPNCGYGTMTIKDYNTVEIFRGKFEAGMCTHYDMCSFYGYQPQKPFIVNFNHSKFSTVLSREGGRDGMQGRKEKT